MFYETVTQKVSIYKSYSQKGQLIATLHVKSYAVAECLGQAIFNWIHVNALKHMVWKHLKMKLNTIRM